MACPPEGLPQELVCPVWELCQPLAPAVPDLFLSRTINTPTSSAFPLTGATCRIQMSLPHLIPALMIKWFMKKKKLSNNPKHRALIAPFFRITSSNGNAHASGDNYSVSRRDLCSHIIGKILSS